MSTKVRLEISEDEMRDLLTKIWHMSGYDIDKKDPVVIEYMMHKIILRQYEEHMQEQTKFFLDKFLPYLNEANAKFESKKTEFIESAEKKQKEMLDAALKSVSEACQKSINKTTTDACQRILDNLKLMITHLREQEETLLTRIGQMHAKFEATAEWYEKRLRWCEYIVGGSSVFASLCFGLYGYFFAMGN
jgi:hypothetical protein